MCEKRVKLKLSIISPYEKEIKPMAVIPTVLKRVLSEKLAESIARPLPGATSRRVRGTVYFPGKATAVTGVRRGGKTTFVHQLRAGDRGGLRTPAPKVPIIPPLGTDGRWLRRMTLDVINRSDVPVQARVAVQRKE